jgi:hypothetical protein
VFFLGSIFYFITLVITALWSTWLYSLWGKKAKKREDSLFRFIVVLSPSSIFLLLVLSGVQDIPLINLDMIGLFLINVLVILLSAFLGLSLLLFKKNFRKIYTGILILYNLLGFLIVAGAYIIRNSPVLLIQVSHWLQQWENLDFFSFAWVGLDVDSDQKDISGMLNKIIIALCSYIPISIARFAYANHQRIKLQKEYEELKEQFENLENKVELQGKKHLNKKRSKYYKKKR